MAAELIYAFRVMRLPLLDAGGAPIGRIEDVVVVSGHGAQAPTVLGFVAGSQRRRIFVSATRIATLDGAGARLKSWDVDLNPFRLRAGERLLGRDILNHKLGDETVSDVGLGFHGGTRPGWHVAKVRLVKRSLLNPRPSYRLVDWEQVASLFAPDTPMAAEAARLRTMHPSDIAHVVRSLPLEQRRLLAEALDDERLADVLEEMPEDEQLRLIEGLDLERLSNVLDEMEYDDLADLLAQMPGEKRMQVLEAMDDEDAETVRRLLEYPEGTAGSLMTPDIVVMSPDATVAEALARIREPDWLVSIAAQVFVAHAPHTAPTGRYLGVVHFQRLLREPPHMTLGRCIEDEPVISPTATDREVAVLLASHNLLAVGVTDASSRLLGAITVDDVLDGTLPANWRRHGARGVAS